MKTIDKYSKNPGEVYWEKMFGENVPGLHVDFRFPFGVVAIGDPEIVNELYVTKNKYFDKTEKHRRMVSNMFGNSLILQRSNENWSTKRKHLSVAFYKEKMAPMLNTIVSITN